MSIIYDRIVELCREKGIKGTSLCKSVGISPNIMTEMKSGRREGVSAKTATKIAEYFGVSVDYLLGNTDIRKTPPGIYELGEVVEMSILSSVRGGYDGAAVVEYSDEKTSFPNSAFQGYSPNECSCLRVKGNSMYPEIKDGDLILIHRQPSVDSGTLAVIIYNSDEATIKRVRYVNGEDWLDLIPINPEYETRRIEGNDLELCSVFGKVISMQRNF